MDKNKKQSGFSLMEMLIATGIMAVGLVMVATIFPVGVKLTTLTTERTTGAVAADEAFAKVQLYGLRDFQIAGVPKWPVLNPSIACTDFQYAALWQQDPGNDGVLDTGDDTFVNLTPDWYEFQYPSSMTLDQQDRNYHWSALCRSIPIDMPGAGWFPSKEIQITVFVNRKIGAAAYHAWDPTIPGIAVSDWPKPVPVNVAFDNSDPAFSKQLQIVDGPSPLLADDSKYFFDGGYTIVDNFSGRMYRVLEVDNTSGILKLQNPWVDNGLPTNETIWVVPPAVGSDRYPCVGVYQKVIRFDDIN